MMKKIKSDLIYLKNRDLGQDNFRPHGDGFDSSENGVRDERSLDAGHGVEALVVEASACTDGLRVSSI